MPLELGLFLGAKRFGTGKQKLKNCPVLDVERYRYQRFISDIAGRDIVAHGGTPALTIRAVRDWLSDTQRASGKVPGGAAMIERYQMFRQELPALCALRGLVPEDLTFNEFLLRVEEWLAVQRTA